MYEQIKVSKCKRCGKEFVKAPQTVFGDFCSYGCKLAAERAHEEMIKKRGEMARREKDKRKTKKKEGRLRITHSRKTCLQYTQDGKLVAKYDSIMDAAEAVGVSNTCISLCLRGKQHTAKGFVWRCGEKRCDNGKK